MSISTQMEDQSHTMSSAEQLPVKLEVAALPQPHLGEAIELQAVEAKYPIANVIVNTRKHCIEFPDNTYRHLRPKTFAVLIFLCRNKERLVSKDKLISAIWGDVCVTDDSLVQCIVEIRRALGPEAGKCLRTIARRGYLLQVESRKEPPVKNTKEKYPLILVGSWQAPDEDSTDITMQGLRENIIMRMLRIRNTPITIADVHDENSSHHSINSFSGVIQIHKDSIRASVSLKNPSNGNYIWANVYQTKWQGDTFEVQDNLSNEIAQDVVTAVYEHSARM